MTPSRDWSKYIYHIVVLTEIYCRFTINRLSYHTTGWHLLDKLPDEIKRNAEFRCAVGDRLRNVGNTAQICTGPVLGDSLCVDSLSQHFVSVRNEMSVCGSVEQRNVGKVICNWDASFIRSFITWRNFSCFMEFERRISFTK